MSKSYHVKAYRCPRNKLRTPGQETAKQNAHLAASTRPTDIEVHRICRQPAQQANGSKQTTHKNLAEKDSSCSLMFRKQSTPKGGFQELSLVRG